MSRCKNICYKLNKEKPVPTKYLIFFSNGFKLCRECYYFIQSNDIRCPCCKMMYATRPRTGYGRRKLLDLRGVKRI